MGHLKKYNMLFNRFLSMLKKNINRTYCLGNKTSSEQRQVAWIYEQSIFIDVYEQNCF